MWTDVLDLNEFYASSLGQTTVRLLRSRLREVWPSVRGDTASGSVTKAATLETGLEIRVPLFIKEGEKVKVHTETREFAGRA